MQNSFGIKIKKGLTMNKKRLFILILLLLPTFVFSHTLLLNVFDNEDNTINVEGIFNTGQLAPGAEIRLESLNTGEILYKKRLPDESELTIDIPNEPYQIVLDGGPGHQVVNSGIEPKNGFSKQIKKNKKESKLSQPRTSQQGMTIEMIISVSIAFLLLFLTIFISIRNTNKLMLQLKQSR